ncbi:MAG: zinc-binding dehydrogenase [Dehalococcoidia bacterium]
MKAVFMQEHGGPEVMQYGDQPDPTPGEGEIVVRVRAASLNRLDLYTRAGLRGTKQKPEQLPRILGGDCAGEVAALGKGVSGLSEGQRVLVNPLITTDPFPQMIGTHRQGSYAELVAVPAANAVPLPDGLDYVQAAALPTVFLPAWSIVVREGKLTHNETAMVLSASSGVGTAAIQIIKGVVGAKCIAVTSTGDKVRKAHELGADYTVNYTSEDLPQRIKDLTRGQGVDLVVDSAGAQFFETAFGALARGGRFGTCGVTSGYQAQIHLGQLFSKELRVFGVFMGPTQELQQIVQAAGEGKIKSAIHRTLPLQNAAQAHEEMERSEHFGKFVLTVD